MLLAVLIEDYLDAIVVVDFSEHESILIQLVLHEGVGSLIQENLDRSRPAELNSLVKRRFVSLL